MHITVIFIFTYADIAVWVLNNQITKDENDPKIIYNYELIDDFQPPPFRKQFGSPLHCCGYFCCHKSLATDNHVAVLETGSYKSSDNHAADLTSPETGSYETSDKALSKEDKVDGYQERKDDKPKYEPTNHLLYIMVSKLLVFCHV